LLLQTFRPWLRTQPCLGFGAQRRSRLDELLRQLLVEQREYQVVRVELGVSHPARELLRGRDGFL
jgi:hypothetical protein